MQGRIHFEPNRIGRRKGMRNVSLKHLLQWDQRAAAFYESLHPCVKRAVDSRMDEIDNVEDLSAVANNAMTQGLREFGGIYDDSETWPD